MKYFTLDLIKRFGSKSDTVANKANKEFEYQNELYQLYLERNEKHLNSDMRFLLNNYYLHDARMLIPSSDLLARSCSNKVFTLQLVLNGGGHFTTFLVLYYQPVSPVQMTIHKGHGFRKSHDLYWSRDEIEVLNERDKLLQHSILLNDAVELNIRFRNFHLSKYVSVSNS